jgi:ribosomal protein L12E/L44/L45/RPP1/RPP2
VVPVALLHPAAMPHQRKRRRRRRVRRPAIHTFQDSALTHRTEKEESDEDMGFGLFD